MSLDLYNSYTNYGQVKGLADDEFGTTLVNHGMLGGVVSVVEAVLPASHQAAGDVSQTGLHLGTAHAI